MTPTDSPFIGSGSPREAGVSTTAYGRTRRIARISVFTALAVVGSFIPLPGPIPSLAFDSASGYFCALSFAEVEGALVLFLGHLATAYVHGFPLGALHLPLAIGLAFQGWLMVKVTRRFGMAPSTTVGITVNTLLTFLAVPLFGLDATVAFLLPVFVASLANGAAAYVVAASLGRRGVLRSVGGRGSNPAS